MKYLLILAMALSLAACGAAEEEKKSGNHINGDYEDITDYSLCQGSGPSPRSIEGTWYSEGRSEEGVTFRFAWTFNNKKLFLSNTCYAGGRSVTARISVPATYNSSFVEVLNGSENTTSIDQDDFHLDCSISVEPMTATYSFYGKCLVLKVDGYEQDLKLVPNRY